MIILSMSSMKVKIQLKRNTIVGDLTQIIKGEHEFVLIPGAEKSTALSLCEFFGAEVTEIVEVDSKHER